MRGGRRRRDSDLLPENSLNFNVEFAQLHLPPALDHLGLDISGFHQLAGLVSPSDFTMLIVTEN